MLHSFQRAGSGDKKMSFEFAVTHTHTHTHKCRQIRFNISNTVKFSTDFKTFENTMHICLFVHKTLWSTNSCTSCSLAKVVTYASALAWNERSVFVGTIFKVVAEHKMQTEDHKTKEQLGFPLFTVMGRQHRHKMLFLAALRNPSDTTGDTGHYSC